MRWSAQQIAHVARAAGFDHDNIVTATAVALATSGGLDHYDYRPGSPGSGHYVGLWGIDVDRHPDYASRPLDVPYVAAKTAHELCDTYRDWSWSPVWRAGHWQAYVERAGVEHSRRYGAQPVVLPVTMYDNAHRYADTIARIRAGRASDHAWRLRG